MAESAGNELIREMLARLHTHVHLFRLHYDTQVTYLAMGEHDEVLAGIAGRDPEAAAYAMRQHIMLSGDRFRRLFDRAEERTGSRTALDEVTAVTPSLDDDPIRSDPI